MSYDQLEAQGNNALSLVIFATIDNLRSYGWEVEEDFTVSGTGGEEGSDGVRTFELTVELATNNPVEAGVESDEPLNKLFEQLLATIAYEFALHQKFIIEYIVKPMEENVSIPSSSPWSIPQG